MPARWDAQATRLAPAEAALEAAAAPLRKSASALSIKPAAPRIARLACARLDKMGKDPTVIFSKVGLTPEEARDPAIRLGVRTQIKLLELAAEEALDEWLGFHLARSLICAR